MLIIIILLGIIFLANPSRHSFYYPDEKFSRLFVEKRTIDLSQTFEEALVKEYMLGPIRYDLKLPTAANIRVYSVWLIPSEPEKTIAINFNEDFRKFVLSTNTEDITWFIRGLSETIKANTKAKKLYLLSENRMIYGRVEKLNLAYPIRLYEGKKK
jgi:hypothetical protein